MAKTAKSDSIGLQKDKLILEIDRIRVRIKQLANTVPAYVMNGDAVIAARWIEHAQVSYFRPYAKIANKKKSVAELEEMLEEERELIRSLENPPTINHSESVTINDLFS
jgi:hypothetical protein